MAEGFYEDIERERIHEVPLDELFGILDTSHNGLNDKQVQERITRYGKNAITEKKKTPFILRFGKHLTNQFAMLLWVGAILSFFAEYFHPGEGMLYIGIALVSVIFLNAFFTFWQEGKVAQAMAAFKKMLSVQARVVRDGREQEIDASELVPGDILILS
ncbi:cation-transporting P-type ATPase, partial [Candidatus Woesearchaeota archaeon]|nr:cation-transporting P-type ATPase [Candidatus Woesearchaeota archaeon]